MFRIFLCLEPFYIYNLFYNHNRSYSLQLARQLVAAQLLAERQIAVQIAATRERLVWFIPFSLSSFAFLYRGYVKTKSFVVMFPLIPLSFAMAYQIDFAYGTKGTRIKGKYYDMIIHTAFIKQLIYFINIYIV